MVAGPACGGAEIGARAERGEGEIVAVGNCRSRKRKCRVQIKMTPQFDTRPLSCKQRQQARVKSSYLLGFLRIAAMEADSNQPHAPSAVCYSSQGARLSIAPLNAQQSRSVMPKRGSQSIQTSSLGTSAQPATPSWECQERYQATYYARTRQPFASSEKRMHCQLCLSLRLLRPHPLKKESLKQFSEKNGGKRTGKGSWILTGTSVPT